VEARVAGGETTSLKQLLFASSKMPLFQNAVSIASWKIFFSLPLSSFLLKKKKKAIWCQIHSWHIIKGSTKNVPDKLKAKPQQYTWDLISIPEFQRC
jgi:hypothetical protein